ncbi:hypothetical protein MIR68_002714 [Amoeboaphelidium protococcarum]|nr:hypothetical protein MIR68_002714 [Amoeboaphelidium protococcarum]KAI3653134.1 hypothetical protein MP228_002559 [Amoeboaphelidium protococcarum]
MSSLEEALKPLAVSKKKPLKGARIPLDVINEMSANGAIVNKLEGEELYSVTGITFEDNAWITYEKWAGGIDKDPRVGANFGPGPNLVNSALVPTDNLIGSIQREARSIVNHYAGLRAQDFENENHPQIGPPLPAPPIFTRIHHAKLALSSLMNRIQDPPNDYPVLRSLRSGSYICTIDQQWANAGVEIVVFKP